MSAPDRNRSAASVLSTAKLERRTVARGNGRTAVDTSRVATARGSAERLRDAVQPLEHEILVQPERHREARCERLRPAAGEQALELGMGRVMQVVQALDRARERVLAAAHDRIDGLLRMLGELAVGVWQPRGPLM